MIDIIKRGSNVAGLLYYLYGPGKANEHTDPHLIAAWRDTTDLEPPTWNHRPEPTGNGTSGRWPAC